MYRNSPSLFKHLMIGLLLMSGGVALAEEQEAAAVGGQSSPQAVISDEGVSIVEEELRRIIAAWPPEMRRAAANDNGERLEMLSTAVATRKLAAEVDALSPADGDVYWDYQSKLLSLKRRFGTELFLANLQIPDMEDLAKERYETDKKKYAFVPEKRLSSHILFKCMAGQCDRAELRPQVEEVLADLRNGADFEAMVEEHSQDPGTKAKGGRFDRWMQLGELGVEPHYSGGVFEIDAVGEYSDIVDSRFGLHIIRLDDIEPEHYLPYEAVRAKIIGDLVSEYRQLSLKEFEAELRITDDAYINGDVVDRLLAPYKDKK